MPYRPNSEGTRRVTVDLPVSLDTKLDDLSIAFRETKRQIVLRALERELLQMDEKRQLQA